MRKVYFTTFCVIIFLKCSSQPPNSSIDTIKQDTSLIKKFIRCKSKSLYKVDDLENLFIQYINKIEGSKCIADANEEFNRDEFRNAFQCNVGLILIGESKKNDLKTVVLDIGTGSPYRCYIFRYRENEILSLVVLDIENGIKRIRKIKKILSKGKYSFKINNYRRIKA